MGSFLSKNMKNLQKPRESVVKLGNKMESVLGGLGSGFDKKVDALANN
jgi:hypothetical protein